MASSDIVLRLLRSRKTILEILSKRGYNTKPFENFGTDEITQMLSVGNDAAFRMDLERAPETTDTGITKCRVLYSIQTKLKPRLPYFLQTLHSEEHSAEPVDAKTTEVIVLVNETVAEIFHSAAYEQFQKHKLRIFFFPIVNLVVNPSEHSLVPKHERVPLAEHSALLKQFNVERKSQIMWIRFHEDMQARVLGLVPLDLVKITRPSPSSGEYVLYRACLP
jgi:DNA-directed RNA polymerase subunit H (RpoH/RPB5)